MDTIELQREAVAKASEPTDLVTALALKAEAVLGYSWLRRKLKIELGSLSRVLNEIGLEPFRLADVESYKMKKAEAEEKRVWAEFRNRAKDQGLGPGYLSGSYVRARWQTIPLKKYDGPIPEFALSHAIQIKQQLPAATFEVQELRIDQRYDPFLIVSCGRERFYIDVWEEREFEKQHVYESQGTDLDSV